MMRETATSTEYVYKGKILNLRTDTVKTGTGQTASREVVEHVDSVGIIAIDEHENILLVNQFRYPVDESLLEIPAGCVETGENPELTAVRELREETGFAPGHIKRLGGFYLAPGYATEYMHIYLATGLRYSPLIAEDTESISLVKKTLPEIKNLIASGLIKDCKTIAAIAMLASHNGH